ncbi:MAG: HTTM domain-containing protein, partial [Bacteroidota bacterium]
MKLYNKSQLSSIAPLVVFRLLFGALTFFGTARFLLKGWVSELYIDPQFYFGFYGFEWVKPLAGTFIYLPFIIMLFGSLGVILGYYYRISIISFFLSFTYIELLDKTNYLNHYYFVSLVAFLLIWLPANAAFSLDTKANRIETRKTIPKFYIQIIQFQLACVYIFAGIAKLNSDWLLHAEPLFTWLQSHRDLPFFGTIFSQKWSAYTFSWFGCFYDLFIVFFLLNKKTRPFAYFFVVAFHLMTAWLFPIGVFPYVMISLTLIFFSEGWHEKIVQRLKSLIGYTEQQESDKSNNSNQKGIYYTSIFFIALQIIIPFRYIAYPGNLFWNEEGFRFSWRVMLMHKEGNATFYIRDPKTKGEIEIVNSRY